MLALVVQGENGGAEILNSPINNYIPGREGLVEIISGCLSVSERRSRLNRPFSRPAFHEAGLDH